MWRRITFKIILKKVNLHVAKRLLYLFLSPIIKLNKTPYISQTIENKPTISAAISTMKIESKLCNKSRDSLLE